MYKEKDKSFRFHQYRPYVIAEIGLHHYGNVKHAKQLIDLAAKGNANAVKLQMFTNQDLYTKKDIANRIMKNYTLYPEAYFELANYAQTKGLDFACTVFRGKDLDFIDPLVSFHKVASCDLDHVSFLKKIGGKRKPVLLSTAGGSTEEIDRACQILLESQAPQIILMHCVMLYPTPTEYAKIERISQLKTQYEKVKEREEEIDTILIGYSDHTRPSSQMETLALAFRLGAYVLEKHFTDQKETPELDHNHSMDCTDLLFLQEKLKKTVSHPDFPFQNRTVDMPNEKLSEDSLLLDYQKKEKEILQLSRRSIVTQRSLLAGQIIQEQDLSFKRPQRTIPASAFYQILGKKIKKDLPKDHFLAWNELFDPTMKTCHQSF